MIDENQIKKLLLKYRKDIGRVEFNAKQSTLFALKSSYGSSLDPDLLSKVYDEITQAIKKEKDGN